MPPFTSLYRNVCYDIASGGSPSVAQSVWLACSNHWLYKLYFALIIWLHLGVTFVETPVKLNHASYAGMALNFFIAVSLLLDAALVSYWRRQLDGDVSYRMIAQAAIAILYLVDATVVAINPYTTGGKNLLVGLQRACHSSAGCCGHVITGRFSSGVNFCRELSRCVSSFLELSCVLACLLLVDHCRDCVSHLSVL